MSGDSCVQYYYIVCHHGMDIVSNYVFHCMLSHCVCHVLGWLNTPGI
jgi:hypothetical protein